MSAAFTYSPAGVDSITFACYSIGFWQPTLERFGFGVVQPQKAKAEEQGVVALAHGDVRLLLIDPTNRARGAEVDDFLVEHGDMQVLSVAVLVDDAVKAQRELSMVVDCSSVESGEDAFGEAKRFRLTLPGPSTVTWLLVERPRQRLPSADSWKSRGVDHFAIAVPDLAQWEDVYHALGFETIYVPKEEIAGEHSGMKTVAVQRGGWVVALVAGVDKALPSQVSTYVRTHGQHAIQHAAIRFDNLREALRELMDRGVQFRLRRMRPDSTVPVVIDDVMHEGKDHSGPLLQCFTKPLARRPNPKDPAVSEAGFFFELIQRISAAKKESATAQAFHDPTVIGLYRSIEYEEIDQDSGLVFADIGGYRFSEWLADTLSRT